jgi:hypothetical protein
MWPNGYASEMYRLDVATNSRMSPTEALFEYVFRNSLTAVQQLLATNAPVDVCHQDVAGCTIFHRAAGLPWPDIFKALLTKWKGHPGVELAFRMHDVDGRTPMHRLIDFWTCHTNDSHCAWLNAILGTACSLGWHVTASRGFVSGLTPPQVARKWPHEVQGLVHVFNVCEHWDSLRGHWIRGGVAIDAAISKRPTLHA